MHLDYRKTFLLINFLYLVRSAILLKEFIVVRHQERQSQLHKQWRQGLFARDDEQDRCTIPMPMFARRPSTMSSLIPLPQSSVVGQQRQQISELQFDKFPHPQSFLVSKKSIQKLKRLLVRIFHRKICSGSKKWRWCIHGMKQGPLALSGVKIGVTGRTIRIC